MKNSVMLILTMLLSGCVGSYQTKFDCGIPGGESCKSLYEVNKMADEGKFHPLSGIVKEECECKKRK
jgi:hypothetical protein